MKLLKDAVAECNVSNLIISGTYDSLPENQISAECMYIEIIKVFEIFGIIADIKLIHAIHLIFTTTVKSESRRM